MPRTNPLKQQRFNIRLTSDAKERIERAASMKGKTASGFMLSCALAQAEVTIREHEQMVLSRTDAEAFFDALVHPPKITGALAAALKEHERRASWE
ncbi:MAG: DUF1778 domain-containing protein [Spirochaetaceae bacterium]|nr:DUF1778 domain-containing protein [Spirochaetaceae bacterium]